MHGVIYSKNEMKIQTHFFEMMGRFVHASRGKLMEYMESIGKHEWNPYFLHAACANNKNLKAIEAIVHHGFDINQRDEIGRTPVINACLNVSVRALELLYVMGADLSLRDFFGRGPLENAFSTILYSCYREDRPDPYTCVRFLLANGFRLVNLLDTWTYYRDFIPCIASKNEVITQELVDFERGVLSCRLATVSFLRVKRAGKLWQWDKFLLAFIAQQVWATRTEEEWRV